MIRPEKIEIIIPDQFSLMEKFEGEGGFVAQVSADLKTWTSIPFIHGEITAIKVPQGTEVRYLLIPRFTPRISEINAYAGGKALPRETWRASNLFASFASRKFTKAWSGPLMLKECAKGSYLCVALNGKHGIEGATSPYVRLMAGISVRMIERLPSPAILGNSIIRNATATTPTISHSALI